MSWTDNFQGVLIPPKTPTLDKVSACKHDAHVLGQFLEWLQAEHGDKEVSDLHIDRLLHEYLEIDAEEEERERRELLAYQRLLNEWGPIRKELGLDDGGKGKK